MHHSDHLPKSTKAGGVPQLECLKLRNCDVCMTWSENRVKSVVLGYLLSCVSDHKNKKNLADITYLSSATKFTLARQLNNQPCMSPEIELFKNSQGMKPMIFNGLPPPPPQTRQLYHFLQRKHYTFFANVCLSYTWLLVSLFAHKPCAMLACHITRLLF